MAKLLPIVTVQVGVWLSSRQARQQHPAAAAPRHNSPRSHLLRGQHWRSRRSCGRMHRPQTRPQGCWTCRCATSYGARRQRSMNWRKRQAASMRWRCQEGTRRCCARDSTIRGLVLCFEGPSGTLPSHTTTCVISASCAGEACCEGGRRRGPGMAATAGRSHVCGATRALLHPQPARAFLCG